MAAEFNHHDTEAQLKVDGREYAERRDAGASAEEKYGMLDDMEQDTDDCIQSREEENEYLGNDSGDDAFERHADRVGVLEANNAAYALERHHVAEVEDGRESSAWNEETQDWGPIKEDTSFRDEADDSPIEDDGGERDMDMDDDDDD